MNKYTITQGISAFFFDLLCFDGEVQVKIGTIYSKDDALLVAKLLNMHDSALVTCEPDTEASTQPTPDHTVEQDAEERR